MTSQSAHNFVKHLLIQQTYIQHNYITYIHVSEDSKRNEKRKRVKEAQKIPRLWLDNQFCLGRFLTEGFYFGDAESFNKGSGKAAGCENMSGQQAEQHFLFINISFHKCDW